MKVKNILILVLICLNFIKLCIGKEVVVEFRQDIHSYYEGMTHDPFSKLINEIQNISDKQVFENEKDYLIWLLKKLKISPHSQLLVYSTTSLQLSRISPQNPRAIYFSDDIYIGYVPGGQIEVIGIDPQKGAITYIFDIPPKDSNSHPTIYRSRRCMNCHASREIGGVPSLLLSSVIPNQGGGTIDGFRKNKFGHEISYNLRFGGWHISGDNPFPISWANKIGIMRNGEVFKIDNPPGKFFNWNKYPVNSSNISAHLVLEHQVGFTNMCIAINYKIREINSNKVENNRTKILEDFINQESNKLLSYILFKNEPPLPLNKTINSNSYLNDFELAYPLRNKLRTLDLKTRLLKNRCSYMIFSNSFLGLPESFKKSLLHDLHEIMTCKSNDLPDEFSYLSEKERIVINQTLLNSTLSYAYK